jgi:hypothetical protein
LSGVKKHAKQRYERMQIMDFLPSTEGILPVLKSDAIDVPLVLQPILFFSELGQGSWLARYGKDAPYFHSRDRLADLAESLTSF